MEEHTEEFRIPDYAELKDPPPRQSVLQTGISSEGIKSGSVSRSKFDLVKDRLKKVQVSLANPHTNELDGHKCLLMVCVCHTSS